MDSDSRDVFELHSGDLYRYAEDQNANLEAKESVPLRFRILHAQCKQEVVYAIDEIDLPLSDWHCSCGAVWREYQISGLPMSALRSIFVVAVDDPREGPSQKLVEVQERGVRFTRLEPSTREDIRSARFKMLQDWRSR